MIDATRLYALPSAACNSCARATWLLRHWSKVTYTVEDIKKQGVVTYASPVEVLTVIKNLDR